MAEEVNIFSKGNQWLEKKIPGYSFCEKWACKAGEGVYAHLPERETLKQIGSSMLSGTGKTITGLWTFTKWSSKHIYNDFEWKKNAIWCKDTTSRFCTHIKDNYLQKIANKIAGWSVRNWFSNMFIDAYVRQIPNLAKRKIVDGGQAFLNWGKSLKDKSLSGIKQIPSLFSEAGRILIEVIKSVAQGIWWVVSFPFRIIWFLIKSGKDFISPYWTSLRGKIRQIDLRDNCIVSGIRQIPNLDLGVGRLWSSLTGKIHNINITDNFGIKVISKTVKLLFATIIGIPAALTIILIETGLKVMKYFWSSLFLFGCVARSCSLVSSASLEYLSLLGRVSLENIFAGGVIAGVAILAIRTIFSNDSLTSRQDHVINILLGMSILVITSLSPIDGLVVSFATAGFWAVKTVYRILLPEKDLNAQTTAEKEEEAIQEKRIIMGVVKERLLNVTKIIKTDIIKPLLRQVWFIQYDTPEVRMKLEEGLQNVTKTIEENIIKPLLEEKIQPVQYDDAIQETKRTLMEEEEGLQKVTETTKTDITDVIVLPKLRQINNIEEINNLIDKGFQHITETIKTDIIKPLSRYVQGKETAQEIRMGMLVDRCFQSVIEIIDTNIMQPLLKENRHSTDRIITSIEQLSRNIHQAGYQSGYMARGQEIDYARRSRRNSIANGEEKPRNNFNSLSQNSTNSRRNYPASSSSSTSVNDQPLPLPQPLSPEQLGLNNSSSSSSSSSSSDSRNTSSDSRNICTESHAVSNMINRFNDVEDNKPPDPSFASVFSPRKKQ